MTKTKRIFVTNFPSVVCRVPVDQTICFDCLTKEEKTLIKKSDDNAFQIWEEYSDGWIGSPVCDRCRLSIPVYVDGDESCPSYYTVIVPFVEAFATEWHPTDPNFAPLSRGAFKTEGDAIKWARAHLEGTPYSIKYIDPNKEESL